MLELVRRTGTEFGIAVIVASHLLGEIERVCDFLVAIDAGRLLRAAPLGAFTERTGVLAVEVEEGEAAARGGPDRPRAPGRRRRPDGPASRSTDDRPVRHRPRRGRRPRPAARPHRAAPPRASRTCSATTAAAGAAAPTAPAATAARAAGRAAMTGATPARSDDRADHRERPGRQHLRPRLPGVRRAAPRPAERRDRRCSPSTLRACFGIGRGGRAKIAPFALAALAILPAILAVGFAALAAQAGGGAASRRPRRSATRPTTGSSSRPRDAVLRGAGARAVRPRPALRRAAAVLLAGPDPRSDYALAKVGGLFVAAARSSTWRPHVRPVRRAGPRRAPIPSPGSRDELPRRARVRAAGAC